MHNAVGLLKNLFAIALCLALCLAGVPEVRAYGTHLDFSFSSDGKILTEFGTIFSPRDDFAWDVDIQSNGKIIVAGRTSTSSGGYDIAVARYNSDGTLDTSFDTDGKTTADVVTHDEVSAVAVQGNGKIVVAGQGGGDFAVVRFNSDGSLDTTFAGDGSVLIDFNGFNDFGNAVAIQPDGKIVVAGLINTSASGANKNWGVARLNTDGTLDMTFDGNGVLATDFLGGDDRADDVLVEADGKIVVGGYAFSSIEGNNFAAARYNSNGSLDTSFSGDGKAVFPIGDSTSDDKANALARTSDGKYILAGGIINGLGLDAALARLTATGALDTTFGTGGKVVTDLHPNDLDAATDVVLQSDDKIVVTYKIGGDLFDDTFGLARYNTDGTLDPTFGTGGKVNTVFGTGEVSAQAIAYQPLQFLEDRLVAVGTYISGGDTDFAIARYRLSGAAVPADFSEDGRADFAVFRPSANAWYISDNQTSAFTAITWGLAGDVLVPGDYERDGKTDAAVFRHGNWYILQSSNNAFVSAAFGLSGDIPVQGDYDGDGRTDMAVFRPSDARWYIQRSTLGYTDVAFGLSTDKPAQGDYDGDGLTDVAVFRDGSWYIQRSLLGFTGLSFGAAGDKPVSADYDGDGKTDVALFRPSNGGWYVRRSQSNTFSAATWGVSTDIPSPADFDGDGKADLTVFRPSTGAWYVLQSTNNSLRAIVWGTGGDVPISATYVPQ